MSSGIGKYPRPNQSVLDARVNAQRRLSWTLSSMHSQMVKATIGHMGPYHGSAFKAARDTTRSADPMQQGGAFQSSMLKAVPE